MTTRLTSGFSGIVLRCFVALVLVFITYNPTGWSYVHWVKADFESGIPMKVLAGLALLITFIIFLRATARSIGLVGSILVAGLIAAVVWVLVDLGVLSIEDPGILQWLALLAGGLILGIGVSWSIVRRWLTGQMDVDDVEES